MIVGALTCTLALCGALGLAGCDASDGESASTTSGMASSTADADKDSSLAGAVRQAATEQDRADSQKEAQAVQQAIEAVTASYGTSVSVAYLPVGDADGAVYINGDTQRSSASMIKLIVLATLLDKAAAGEVDLDAEVKVRSEDIVAGTGTVQEDGPGAYQLRELARRMIADSDNTATNVIVDLIGMDAVNAEAGKLGLANTVMARKMMDTEAASRGMQNRMSASDAAAILNLIATGTLVNQEMSDLALDFLLQQSIDAGLTDGIPDGVSVAHKTGELTQVEHDGGIVLAAKPYVLVVMTEGVDNLTGVSLIADVSRAVYVATNGSEGVPEANVTAQAVRQAVEEAGDGALPWEYDEPGVAWEWSDDGADWSGSDDTGGYDDSGWSGGGDASGDADWSDGSGSTDSGTTDGGTEAGNSESGSGDASGGGSDSGSNPGTDTGGGETPSVPDDGGTDPAPTPEPNPEPEPEPGDGGADGGDSSTDAGPSDDAASSDATPDADAAAQA